MRRAAVLLVLIFVGCGTPSGAVRIPDEQVPFPVKRTEQPPRPSRETEQHTISFVRAGRLVGVPRDISVSFGELEAVVRTLLEGPTTEELSRGIRSEIPQDTRLLTVRANGRIAEVDLSSEFQAPGPRAQILLRVGQVVRTLTALEDVDAVRFAVNGESISVPTHAGRLRRTVTLRDYAALLPKRR